MKIIYLIVVILLALWLIGLIFDLASGFIHLLLVLAAILILYRVIRALMKK